jgi:acetyl esterase/lipase
MTGTLAAVANTVLGPSENTGDPSDPAGVPALGALVALAFTRREFDPAERVPSLQPAPVDAVTTSAVTPDAAAGPTLTYTAPPSITDRITLAGYHLVDKITRPLGIDWAEALGKALAIDHPPHVLTYGLTSQTEQVEVSPGNVWTAYVFTPPDPSGKTVIAIHGGGFTLQPSVLNWIDYTVMVRQTGATVVVPLYPLATTDAGAAINVDPEMANFIVQQIDATPGGAANVSIYADSAGSSIAYGAVRELILRGDTEHVPASMVLISMVADSSLTNPAIKTINDPFFDVNNLTSWNSDWFDGLDDRQDPLVSPLYMEDNVLNQMPPTTIYVGSEEILYPDTILLYDRAAAVGAPISVVVGVGQVHDWPVPGFLVNSQAAVVRPDIYRELGLTSDAESPAV